LFNPEEVRVPFSSKEKSKAERTDPRTTIRR